MMLVVWLLGMLLVPSLAQATNYYISPSGSNSNDGLSTGAPFLTFAHAINASRAWCGDYLIALDGTYGDGTSTGKLSVSAVVCTVGDELTITALNQRKAKIVDNGSGTACAVDDSAYIVLDGLVCRSTNNASFTTSQKGVPLWVQHSNYVRVQNGVYYNPNKYSSSNNGVYYSNDILVEDNEIYDYHRHGLNVKHSARVVVRRLYCHPRLGRIAGGQGASNGIGKGDACLSFYPATNSIAENAIAEGETYLIELNAEYTDGGGNIPGPMASIANKVLGSICLGCGYGNALFPNSRRPGIGGTQQDLLIRDVAVVDWTSSANGIRVSDCYRTVAGGCLIDHVAVYSAGQGTNGIVLDDDADGVSSVDNSATITNTVVTGVQLSGTPSSTGTGIKVTGFGTWNGDYIRVNGNEVNLNPAAPSNWTNVTTTAPDLGTCKGIWAPDGSNLKGAGSGGSDLGPTILYLYIDGVLTTAPLWDPTTGEFPHGDADADGVNRVAGESLFDVHTRLNVNTGGCAFPAGYGMSGGGDPSTVIRGTVASSGTSTTASPLAWNHTVASGQNLLLVCVGMYHSGGSVGSVSGIDVSGQAMTLVRRQVTSPDAYRAVEMWKLASPTSGSRTITATLTGSISGALGRSVEFDDTDGTNTATGGSTAGAATSLSVTAVTNINERVEDCTVSSKSVTYTHGADQTGDTDLDHATQSLRLATSTQEGSNGGVMSNSTGGTVLQAKVAVSLMASPEDPPTGSTFTISNYRIDTLHGTSGTPEVTLGALANQNTPGNIAATGEFRLRAEILVDVAPSEETGVAPYCKKVGGSFLRVGNSFGSGFVRFYGPGAEPTIPSTLTPTTQRFTGTFAAGRTQRDGTLSVVLPVMPSGTRTEVDYQLVAGNGLAANDVLECEIRRNDGTTLGTHTQPMQINIVGPRASMGF